MWIERESNQDIFNKLFDIVNNFNDEAVLVTDEIKNNSINRRAIYNDKGGKALLELYTKIEERKTEIIHLYSEDSFLKYLDKNIVEALEILRINIPPILSNLDMKELDGILSLYNDWNNYDKAREQSRNKKSFIFLFTLFDNNLLDVIESILTKTTNLSPEKIKSKMHTLGRADLNKKLEWFSQFKGGVRYNYEMMEILVCDRNAIIHSSSKYSEFGLNKLSQQNLILNNIEVGKNVDITNEKLLEFINVTQNINKQLIELIISSFRTKKDKEMFKEDIRRFEMIAKNHKNFR